MTYTTHRTHGMADAPRPQPSLHDLEAAALAQHHVGGEDADVVGEKAAIAVRRVVVPKHRQHAASWPGL